MMVKAALLATSNSYQVFLLRESPSSDAYSAIVAAKKENVISQAQQIQVESALLYLNDIGRGINLLVQLSL